MPGASTMAPLTHLRAWVLTDTPAAAYAGKLLLDAGASVALLEPPGGCALRALPPLVHGASTLFAYVAAGMTSRRVPSASALDQLAHVHVVLHDRQALPEGWDEALERLPLLAAGRAVVACTPYGQTGPRSGWQGCELTLFQAGGEGNLMPAGLSHDEFPDRPPVGAGRYVGSYQAGTTAALAALTALRVSRRLGRAERVDVSIQDAQLSLNHVQVSRFADGALERRSTRAFSYGGVLRCVDGYVQVLPIEEHHWAALRSMLGDPEWARRAELEDSLERGRRGAEINSHLAAWAAVRSVRAVVAQAAAAGVPCGPYLAPGELVDEPQFVARGYFVGADATHEPAGRAPGPPWLLGGAPRPPQRAAPALPA